jgi:hypothetical protein
MALLTLCPGDPVVESLRRLFGANLVRVPEERIRPLVVLARRGSQMSVRGELAPLISDAPPLAYVPGEIQSSAMPDVAGQRSRKVDVKLGLQILDGFLKGFGIPSAGIASEFSSARKVSFRFQEVARVFVDVNVLGQKLSGRSVDPANPAARIFIDSAERWEFLVLDSVITSKDFAISVEESAEGGVNLNVPAVQSLVGKASAGVNVSTSSGNDLIFRGPKALGFAFSCVRFELDDHGRIRAIAPGGTVGPLGFGPESASAARGHASAPEPVLLTSAPALLGLDFSSVEFESARP